MLVVVVLCWQGFTRRHGHDHLFRRPHQSLSLPLPNTHTAQRRRRRQSPKHGETDPVDIDKNIYLAIGQLVQHKTTPPLKSHPPFTRIYEPVPLSTALSTAQQNTVTVPKFPARE